MIERADEGGFYVLLNGNGKGKSSNTCDPARRAPIRLSCTLAITIGPGFLLIGRACRVCRIWFDSVHSEDSRVVPIVPDTAYRVTMVV